MPLKKQPTVLIITRNFPPLIGGMERLILYVSEVLARKYSVHLCAPAGGNQYLQTLVKFYPIKFRPLWLFFISSFFKALYATFLSRPSIIFAGSGLTALQAYVCCRLFNLFGGGNCIAVAYLHGLDISSTNFLYQQIILAFIRKLDFVLVNSLASEKLAKRANINKTKLLYPCVQLPPIINDIEKNKAKIQFCQQFNLDINSPLILSVGRITARKGLKEFLENSFPDILRQFPNCQLIIIGDDAKNSAQGFKVSQKQVLQNLIAQNNYVNQVYFLGEKQLNDPLLTLAYKSCQLMIFPVIERLGDPEGFGMIAIEAASYNLPTVAFASGGVVEAVQDQHSGILVNPMDYQQFSSAVNDILSKKIILNQCHSFAEKFSFDHFSEKLVKLLSEELEI